MKELLFRCSRLSAIMTKPKVSVKKIYLYDGLPVSAQKFYKYLENGEGSKLGYKEEEKEGYATVSETCKTYMKEMFLEREFAYKEEVITKQMMKGNLCEAESRLLIRDVLGGEFRERNTERFSNDIITGTPDIILNEEDFVEDVKNSYNLRTFMDAELKKEYFWQAVGYMILTGKKNYRLIYTLNKTPWEIIEEEKKQYYYKFNCDEENEDYKRICNQIDHNNDLIDGLTKKQRVKVFEFSLQEKDIELLSYCAEEAKMYYNAIQL